MDLSIASGRSQRVGGALHSRFGEIYKGRSSKKNSNRGLSKLQEPFAYLVSWWVA